MSSDLPTLAKDVEIIVKAETSTGIKLNTAKCEIIMDDFSKLDYFPIFRLHSNTQGEYDSPWSPCPTRESKGKLWMKLYKAK